MSVFDERPEPKSPGCPICGSANEAIVLARIHKTSNGKTEKGQHSVTRSRSLCLEHAEPVFRRLVAELRNENGRYEFTPRDLVRVTDWYEWAKGEGMTSPDDDDLADRLKGIGDR